jgi:hypothetical protein
MTKWLRSALLLALLDPLDALASPPVPTSDATASPLRMALRQRRLLHRNQSFPPCGLPIAEYCPALIAIWAASR